MSVAASCWRVIFCTVLLCAVAVAAHAGATPELQKKMRAATFEVVRKKPENDPLTYEKPLPLELLPYIERTDAYQSIGTAFALGHNTYVTAAHVLLPNVDSQFGPPALRAANGVVYAIAKVLKFSTDRDFAVFSLENDPAPPALDVNRTPQIDDSIVAVGNALGEGIVIRDGLFTSETPEDQDGRWKWIRFSAAASPGNSGGPLLDASGRVIGIVIGKSPNENLNYSLPIGIVLDAPIGKATFDVRSLSSLDFLQGRRTYRMQGEFPLPLGWAAFAEKYREEIHRHGDRARQELLGAFADTMFPKGPGSDGIFRDIGEVTEPRLIVQGEDNKWRVSAPGYHETSLSADGFVKTGGYGSILLMQLRRSGHAADGAFFADSKQFMDDALKALNLTRDVGGDQVKVTSLGKASTERLFTDAYGRKWQQRAWPVPFLDAYVLATVLPAPDGYVGMVAFTPSLALHEARSIAELTANQFMITYSGTIEQWRMFLRQKALLPAALDDFRLQTEPQWRVQSSLFGMTIPKTVLALNDASRMGARMSYVRAPQGAVWQVGGVSLYRDDRKNAFASLWRVAKPAADANADERNRFTSLRERTSPYDSQATRETTDTLKARTALDVPGTKPDLAAADVIYGLTLQLDAYPSTTQLADREAELRRAIGIVERAHGEEVAAFVHGNRNLSIFAGSPEIPPALRALSVQAGPDGRGKTLADELDVLVESTRRGHETPESLAERLGNLQEYWEAVLALKAARKNWSAFAERNRIATEESGYPDIASAQTGLQRLLLASTSAMPEQPLIDGTKKLIAAYAQERNRQFQILQQKDPLPDSYQPVTRPCVAQPTSTSGHPTAKSSRFVMPQPTYPASSRRTGEAGVVVLAIRIGAQGCVLAKTVLVSTGFPALDEAALDWIETVEFLPAELDGKAVDSDMKFGVTFNLTD